MNQNNENQIAENQIAEKKKRGRTNMSGIQYSSDDKEYYNEYHHLNKHNVTCECGAIMSNFCLTRHLKRKIHLKLMAKKALLPAYVATPNLN
jgi:hypothetical protein